ncbi:MAG: hypothetical protein R3B71_05100 [Candidatus Gracilibacteria bacterium]|nr:hypothetical protein [Candidatus Peregrinibacteria bacterium]
MSEFSDKNLPPISLENLIVGYELDDIDAGPGSHKAEQARAFFGQIAEGIRVKLEDILKDDETPFPIHMMTTPVRGFETLVLDETPTEEELTSPVFFLTRVTFTPPEELTPVVSIPTFEESVTPVYLPPVVSKEHVFDFEDATSWLPFLATEGFSRG